MDINLREMDAKKMVGMIIFSTIKIGVNNEWL
jgi:hypothetical protein